MTVSGAPPARSPGISYQELLDQDTMPVPEVLRRCEPFVAGDADVPIERFLSRDIAEAEVERLWSRAWQMACREEQLPDVGDYVVYDIADLSYVVVRASAEEIKAYPNACLHRGRRLCEGVGRRSELRCPFHGFAWALDGQLEDVPAPWDFPHVTPERFRLPEVPVGTWGGFVFLNPDPGAEPLEQYLGELPQHFARWPLERRYTQAHVAKVLPCNWKIAQEAFMEAYHVVATHPQLLPGIGDANSQYDVFGNVSRAITPNGTPSPHLAWEPDEQQILDSMVDRRLDEPPRLTVAEGATARVTYADQIRRLLRRVLGPDADQLCDAEAVDSFYYTLFPNFHPWGAYNRIVYRFRPNGTEVEESIMECLYLAPWPKDQPKPEPAPIHWLGPDEDWTKAPELGMLGRVFNQDLGNLEAVQRGLHTLRRRKSGVTLANYQETKVRHFHVLYERWMGDALC